MPPLCSTVRMPRVDSRRRTAVPRMSDSSDVSCRFGRKRRRVRLLAWLTLLPASTPLPVIWQRRGIAEDPYRVGRGGLWRSRQGASSVPPARRQAGALPLTHQRALPSGLPPRAGPLEPFTFGWIAKAPPLLGAWGQSPPGGLSPTAPPEPLAFRSATPKHPFHARLRFRFRPARQSRPRPDQH